MHIYTVGHSNRDLDVFIDLLAEFSIEAVADVRRFPSSRSFPHFNQGNLKGSLADAGIEYSWWEQLGGRRDSSAGGEESPNIGLENTGFRNYADYMMTDAFQEPISQLLEVAEERRTVIMCSERVFWKCHRRLISDYLVAKDHRVLHILDSGDVRPHLMSEIAQVRQDGFLVYPGTDNLNREQRTPGLW